MTTIRDRAKVPVWTIAAVVVAAAAGAAIPALAAIGASGIMSDAIESRHIRSGNVRATDIGTDAVGLSKIPASAENALKNNRFTLETAHQNGISSGNDVTVDMRCPALAAIGAGGSFYSDPDMNGYDADDPVVTAGVTITSVQRGQYANDIAVSGQNSSGSTLNFRAWASCMSP